MAFEPPLKGRKRAQKLRRWALALAVGQWLAVFALMVGAVLFAWCRYAPGPGPTPGVDRSE